MFFIILVLRALVLQPGALVLQSGALGSLHFARPKPDISHLGPQRTPKDPKGPQPQGPEGQTPRPQSRTPRIQGPPGPQELQEPQGPEETQGLPWSLKLARSSCGARGRRWAAAAFRVACRRSTQSLPVELRRAWAPLGRSCLRRAWAPLGQAQYTEPPGRAATRVGAAWPRLPFVSQARYTEPPGRAAARVGAAGLRLPFVWQAQYTEPPGRAAARAGAAPLLITTHHSSASHTPLVTSQPITAPLLTPHFSHTN